MRWVLAGLSFALMVSIAVATAGIQTESVHLRGRIESLTRDVLALRIDYERRRASALGGERREVLVRRLRRWTEAVERRRRGGGIMSRRGAGAATREREPERRAAQ